jgi:Ni/Fe-hydrogenase 1 B-type cytochrome subunit
MANPIQRVAVWPRGLRAIHWMLALATITLVVSGWALRGGLRDNMNLVATHITAGWVLALALAIRAYRLFRGKPVESWRALFPDAATRESRRAMLRFYLTLGRAPIPGFYAHNPFWGPVYLALFALLIFSAATGIALASAGAAHRVYYDAVPWLFGFTLNEWHGSVTKILGAFTALHILAVVAQELKGFGGDVSAMINGHKYFQPREVSLDALDRVQAASNKTGRDHAP